MRTVTWIATLALFSLWRRLRDMRRIAFTLCWLASFSLALSPLATVHAHVGADEAVIHGGHSHDDSHSHAEDHADLHVDVQADAHSSNHFIVQHTGQFAHDHAIDGHIVHCDVLAVQPDTSSKTKVAIGHLSTHKPLARSALIFKPPEPNDSFVAHRAYLHPPLRGPPFLR
jgi:hypothetical protein